MKRARFASGLFLCVGLCGPAAGQGRMVGVTFLGTLYEIDLSTGGATLLGPLGVDRLNSLAMRSDGTLWTARAGDVETGEPSRLYTIDPVRLTATLVTEMDPGVDVRGLAWSDDGWLTAMADHVDAGLTSMVRIDPVTGQITTLGALDHPRVQSLECGPDGELYSWDLDSGIFRISDEGAGHTQLSPAFAGSQSIQSLAFGPGGVLYASSGGLVTPQAFGQDGLYVIDPGTWLPTLVGEHGTSLEMRGMAYIPCPGAGVWLLGAGLMGCGRRR